MHKIKQLTIFLLLFAEGAFAQSGIFYNVKDFGAKGLAWLVVGQPAADSNLKTFERSSFAKLLAPAEVDAMLL